MSFMFNGCFSLTLPPNISDWDIKNVSNMNLIFDRCFNLLNPNFNK